MGKAGMPIGVALIMLLTACAPGSDPGTTPAPPATTAAPAAESAVPTNPLREAYFGDLHIHTRWSFDAYSLGVPVRPEDAYRFARGAAIDHVSGQQIRMQGPPLDFMALTEHSEYMGVSAGVDEPDSPLRTIPLITELASPDPLVSRNALQRFAASLSTGAAIPELLGDDVIKPTWQRIIELANTNNEPGKFTAFIGYEYTSMPDGQNLHRNVLFRGEEAPPRPFSSFDSGNPEDLWAWMDRERANGFDLLAIPHNSNASNGLMFPLKDASGAALDADYATTRMRNEPLAEVMQIKGASETHPILSSADEFADFELFDRILGRMTEKSEPHGSYVRDALKQGLAFADRLGVNPYKLGMIGSSDGHNGASAVEENNYFGKIGIADGTPQQRLRGQVSGLADVVDLWGAAGLAGVWAEANTRASIYDALQRKETFATSGPRIRVRFFGGWAYTDAALATGLVETGYADGVAMGGDLPARAADAAAPSFLIVALRDPDETTLQRLQVIKGWLGETTEEKVYDVACSKGAMPDPQRHRCDFADADFEPDGCTPRASLGAAELRTRWQDPDFDPRQRAFYYVRVLQIPTCRWSTYDAAKLGIPVPTHLPRTIQERAITSPIWYAP
jgi:hypothetical protein